MLLFIGFGVLGGVAKALLTHAGRVTFPRKVATPDGEVVVLGSLVDVLLGGIMGALSTDLLLLGYINASQPSIAFAFICGAFAPTVFELLANRISLISQNGKKGIWKALPVFMCVPPKLLR